MFVDKTGIRTAVSYDTLTVYDDFFVLFVCLGTRKTNKRAVP